MIFKPKQFVFLAIQAELLFACITKNVNCTDN